MNEDFYNQLIC